MALLIVPIIAFGCFLTSGLCTLFIGFAAAGGDGATASGAETGATAMKVAWPIFAALAVGIGCLILRLAGRSLDEGLELPLTAWLCGELVFLVFGGLILLFALAPNPKPQVGIPARVPAYRPNIQPTPPQNPAFQHAQDTFDRAVSPD